MRVLIVAVVAVSAALLAQPHSQARCVPTSSLIFT